jgi:hypothetical protein
VALQEFRFIYNAFGQWFAEAVLKLKGTDFLAW